MGWLLAHLGRAARLALPSILVLAAMAHGWAAQAQARGGFALSGSFYAQEFEIPQGSRLETPDVYVVVFNNSDTEINVRLTMQTPVGVVLHLSDEDFALQAGAQKKVEVGVEVSADAAPGEHEISITAEPYKKGVTGIQIMGAAGQSARLIVVGEGARIVARVVSPSGESLAGTIRLLKLRDERRFEVAYSESGEVDVTVAPGRFAAAAYLGGEKLAEEVFDVAAGEAKTVDLVVQTVFFEGFSLVPTYRSGTEDLAFAKLVYTVKNLSLPVEEAEVLLRVSLEGDPLEEVSLASLSPLEVGRVGLSYNYIPVDGWAPGTYGIKLDLLLEGALYTSTREETLTVAGPSGQAGGVPGPLAQEAPSPNLSLLGGIGAGLVFVVLAAALVLRKRRE